MKCPVCKEPNLVISERKGIEIDYCPDCRGIWLDRGELDKILERTREEDSSEQKVAPQAAQNPYPTQPPPPQYSQSYPHHQHPHYYKKRKKSFLEELFD